MEKSIIIATTHSDVFTYEEYCQMCELDNVEPDKEESQDFLERCAEAAEINWTEDLEAIGSYKKYNVPVIVTGSLGLWNGRQDIVPIIKDSVIEAINEIIFGTRCSFEADVNFNLEGGYIEVLISHHDGQNLFEIRALSESGLKKFRNTTIGHKCSLDESDFKTLPYIYE